MLGYLETIADCLAVAHDKGIVHRDIKPVNILFRHDGTLLVSDFGIAKRLGDDSDLTRTGATIGSPSYLSPEQVNGACVDGRSDIYSLGAMAFEMLTGRKPYRGDSQFGTLHQHVHAPVPKLPPHLRRFQKLIERCMAKSPDQRFDETRVLLRYLQQLRGAPQATETNPSSAICRWGEPGAPLEDTEATTLTSPDPRGVTTLISTRVGRKASAAAVVSLSVAAIWASSFVLETSTAREATSREAATSRETMERDHVFVRHPESRPVRVAALLSTDDGAGSPPPLDGSDSAGSLALVAESDRFEPPPITSEDPSSLEEDLLASAQEALSALRLTIPANDNALFFFEQVLAINPDNPAALEGRRRIARRYVSLARKALSDGRLSKARAYVQRGLGVERDSPELLALKSDLARLAEPAPAPPRLAVLPLSPPPPPPPSRIDAEPEIKGESPAELASRIASWFQ